MHAEALSNVLDGTTIRLTLMLILFFFGVNLMQSIGHTSNIK